MVRSAPLGVPGVLRVVVVMTPEAVLMTGDVSPPRRLRRPRAVRRQVPMQPRERQQWPATYEQRCTPATLRIQSVIVSNI